MSTVSKYFLDCGAHNGCSVRLFQHLCSDWREYTIHCFEPNPMFRQCFGEFDNVLFHEAAVWSRDGMEPFFLSKSPKHHGSSLIRSKRTGMLDKENPITVRCLDFNRWIKETIDRESYVILKMDIEGAEYEVLESMIAGGSIDQIKLLYIDFHYDKIGLECAVHSRLVEELQRRRIEICPWDAMTTL